MRHKLIQKDNKMNERQKAISEAVVTSYAQQIGLKGLEGRIAERPLLPAGTRKRAAAWRGGLAERRAEPRSLPWGEFRCEVGELALVLRHCHLVGYIHGVLQEAQRKAKMAAVDDKGAQPQAQSGQEAVVQLLDRAVAYRGKGHNSAERSFLILELDEEEIMDPLEINQGLLAAVEAGAGGGYDRIYLMETHNDDCWRLSPLPQLGHWGWVGAREIDPQGLDHWHGGVRMAGGDAYPPAMVASGGRYTARF
jgi:hypothetical protein